SSGVACKTSRCARADCLNLASAQGFSVGWLLRSDCSSHAEGTGRAPIVRAMWIGLACALSAGLMWGLVFVAPLLLPEYPAPLLAVGRYLAFGLIALP